MNALQDYIAPLEPVRSVEKVRYEISKKAQSMADMFEPDDKEVNEKLAMMWLIAMYETLELVFY